MNQFVACHFLENLASRNDNPVGAGKRDSRIGKSVKFTDGFPVIEKKCPNAADRKTKTPGQFGPGVLAAHQEKVEVEMVPGTWVEMNCNAVHRFRAKPPSGASQSKRPMP